MNKSEKAPVHRKPVFEAKMPALLDEIIAAQRDKAIKYEGHRELAKKVQSGQAVQIPKSLDTPGKRALYNNLSQNENLALKIDETGD